MVFKSKRNNKICSYFVNNQYFYVIFDLVDFLIPLYRSEGKSQLVISVGCTGGRHRSVVFAQSLSEHFNGRDFIISLNHRDIEK